MDISESSIHCMLFGPKFPTLKSTVEFEDRVRQTRDIVVMKDLEHRASLIRWVAGYITE